MKTFMKWAICVSCGYINGQKYEDGQTGTNEFYVFIENRIYSLWITKWLYNNDENFYEIDHLCPIWI